MGNFDDAASLMRYVDDNRQAFEHNVAEEKRRRAEEERSGKRKEFEMLKRLHESQERESYEGVLDEIGTLCEAGYTREYIARKLSLPAERFELIFSGYDNYRRNVAERRLRFINDGMNDYIRGVFMLYSSFLVKKRGLPAEARFCHCAGCVHFLDCDSRDSCSSLQSILLKLNRDRGMFARTFDIDQDPDSVTVPERKGRTVEGSSLSPATKAILMRNSLFCDEDILKFGVENLCRLNRVGRKTVEEVREWLNS